MKNIVAAMIVAASILVAGWMLKPMTPVERCHVIGAAQIFERLQTGGSEPGTSFFAQCLARAF